MQLRLLVSQYGLQYCAPQGLCWTDICGVPHRQVMWGAILTFECGTSHDLHGGDYIDVSGVEEIPLHMSGYHVAPKTLGGWGELSYFN